MDERCFPVEDLGELLRLAPEDPRIAHASRCPRCGARLAAYRGFLRRGDEIEGAREAEADVRLGAFLRETVQGERRAGEARRVKPRFDPLRHLRELLRSHRVLWPSAATAAVVAALLLVVWLESSDERSPIVRRGEEVGQNQAGPWPKQPVWLPDGGCVLNWRGAREADSYRLLFYDAAFEEVARFGTARDTSFALSSGLVRELQGIRGAAFWLVEALSEGDVIASTPPRVWAVAKP